MATWEALGGVFAGGFIAGGPVALLYGNILALAGTMATCLSLAELASLLVPPPYASCFDELLTVSAPPPALDKFTGLRSWPHHSTPGSAAGLLAGSLRWDGRRSRRVPRF
jgi:hypothetical protein